MRMFPARDVPAEVVVLRVPSVELLLLLADRRATPVRAPAATTAVAAAAVARVVGDNEAPTATAEAPLTRSSAPATVATVPRIGDPTRLAQLRANSQLDLKPGD